MTAVAIRPFDLPQPERGLRARGLSKSFHSAQGRFEVLSGIDITVAPGEIAAVYGPNGAGKTTLFSIIAGLTTHDAGSVELDRKPLVDRDVAYLFQDYQSSLFPWLDLIDNVTFAEKMAGVPRAARREAGLRSLVQFGLQEFATSFPYQLSGGMKQKLCFARTLLSGRRVALLDEPFSALDRKAFNHVLAAVEQLPASSRPVILLITHDLDAALLFSDKLLVLSARPARVLKEIVVPLARPRDPAMILSSEFTRVREEVLESALSWLSATEPKDGTT